MGEIRLMLAHRAVTGDWTDEEVLLLARGRNTLRVSKYAKQDFKKLQAARRLEKSGQLKFLCEDRGILFYRAL